MELDLSTHGENNYLKKYLFSLKTHRNDGLILQVHHSYSDSCGDVKRYRFTHATFNDYGTYLGVADHRGNIFIIDLKMEKYWQLPSVGLPVLISFPVLKKHELLISLDNSSIVFCHTDTGAITGQLTSHTMPATEVSYTSDGYYCLTSCLAEAIVWDLQSYIQIHRLSLKPDASLKKVVFMPVTNHILACFQNDTMSVWQFGTFECIKQLIPETSKTHHVRAVALTRNGRAMVVAGHTPNLVIFCLDTWSVRKVVEFPEYVTGIKQLEFVPQVFDGGANKILAMLTTALEIYFFDIETSTFLLGLHQIFGLTGKMAVSSTGKYLATVFTTGEINIYTVEGILSHGAEPENCRAQRLESNSGSRNLSNRSRRTQRSGQSLDSIKRELRDVLDLKKLQPILRQFGEYPESYRGLIWKTILQLPGNQESFVSLTTKTCYSSYSNLESKYPLVNKSLHNSLKKLLSNLSHWCPLFGEVNFLPEFVFPFVKVFHADPLGCFEAVATIIVNWCQNWFEFYPFPPINMLSALENVLGHHDPDLLEFYLRNNITSSVSVCPLFHSAFSEVLSKNEWLKLWDHILSNEPSFFFMAIVAYNVVCRHAIKRLKCSEEIEKFFHNQNPIDMKMLISKTYSYLRETPADIHCRQFFAPFRPLGSGGTYTSFLAYPKLIVDSNVEKLQTIRKEEEEIMEEQMKALTIRQKLDKKLRSTDKVDDKERMYRELENVIRKTVDEEEERVIVQRQKLRNLRQELRLKELEVLEGARDKVLKERAKKKQLELERLVRDISKRKVLEKAEVEVMEEEIRKYYSELLLKKCQLELELGVSDYECEPTGNLELQRDKLKKDLCELQTEWSSLQHNKRIDIANKMASIKKLVGDLEAEVVKEMAKKQVGEPNIGLEKLKAKVRALEVQTEKLLVENLNHLQKKREGKAGSDVTSEIRKQIRKPASALHTGTNSNGKNGVKKVDNVKKSVKTTLKKGSPRVHKVTTTSTRTKRKDSVGIAVGSHEPSHQVPERLGRKTKSRYTCRSDVEPDQVSTAVSKFAGGEYPGECQSGQDDTGIRKGEGRPSSRIRPDHKCVCGERFDECKLLKNRTSRIAKDYSFASDSENEIFKSTLSTRQQLIKEAKKRQGLQ